MTEATTGTTTAAKKPPKKHIYRTTATKDFVETTRFIRATSGLQALAFVTKGSVTVKLAGQDDLLGMSPDKIEDAGEATGEQAAS